MSGKPTYGGALVARGAILLFGAVALLLPRESVGQRIDPNALLAERQQLVVAVWQNGYTFLKPEYRPSIEDVGAALATPQKAASALRREQQAMRDAQQALRAAQTSDGHLRFFGKVLDSMMGALLNAGAGKGGKVRIAESMLNMQPYVEAGNAMIACCSFRQNAMSRIVEIDNIIQQSSRPARLPGAPNRGSPYAF